jgi:hypothetical protein
VSLRDLYEKHHEAVRFLSIYIREAHPIEGWWLGKGLPKLGMKILGLKAATDVHEHTTIEERRAVAGRCEDALVYGIPTLVDEMDDHVNEAYAAWPTRLYLVGQDRRVVYASGLGPFGFKPAELGRAIEQHLERSSEGAQP